MPKLPLKPVTGLRPPFPAHGMKRIVSINGRFRMRTAQTSDACPEVALWMSDPRVVDGLNMTGQAMTVDQLRDWIAGFDNVRKNLVAIRTAHGDAPVGFVMFDIDPRHLTGSFHILIGAAEFRRGEAALAATKFALKQIFDERKAGKVTIEPLSRNAIAVRACELMGFRLEGVLKEHRLDSRSGIRLDQHVFGITRDEYRDWPWR